MYFGVNEISNTFKRHSRFFFLLWISYNTLICVTNFNRKKNDIICRAKTRLFHWKYFVLLQNKKNKKKRSKTTLSD